MKLTSSGKILGILLVTGLVSLIACKKDNNASTSNSTKNDSIAANLSANSAVADYAYDDVFNSGIEAGSDNNIAYMVNLAKNGQHQVNAAGGQGSKQASDNLGCATITISPLDTTSFPKTIVVDFGSGCTGPDGNTRSGKVTYVFTGRLLYPGTTVSATFSNYFFNGYQLQGTYSFTNNSTLSGIAFSTQISNGKIIYPDNSWYTFSGDKHVTQTAGQSTVFNLSDDVYSITGSNVFAASNGNTLNDSITTPLVKANACAYISSGIVSFSYDQINGTLDYGSGTCDSVATITVGTLSKVISLR